MAISDLSETALWRPLTSSQPSNLSVLEIANDSKLRALAEDYSPGLQRLAKPIGLTKEGAILIQEAMLPLLIHYGRPKKLDQEMSTWWMSYYKALADLPMEALEFAVSEYIRTSTIHMVPAAGVLVKFAETRAAQIRTAAYRVKEALKVTAPKPPPTAQEREALKAEMEKFRREMAGGRSAPPIAPRPPAEPMSEEARDMIAAGLTGAAAARARPVA